MVAKGDVVVRAHRGHLRELKRSLILFHLLKKFNCKCEPLSIAFVGRLASAIGAAEEEQVVLARALPPSSHVQGHWLVLLIATNMTEFPSPASLAPKLPIILTKRAGWREVKG